MSDIDWTKVHPQQRKDIPALTTHFAVGTHDHSFVKMPDRYIWAPAYKCWHPMSKIDFQDWFFERLIPIDKYDSLIPNQWQGAGLPPAGIECEAHWESTPKDVWHPVKVLAHDEGIVVFRWKGGERKGAYASYGQPYNFRPIRTPEQIAAEERGHAIKEMLELMVGADDDLNCAHRLYDAGYRKVTP